MSRKIFYLAKGKVNVKTLHGSILFIFNHKKPDTFFLICCKMLLDEKYFTLKMFSIKHFHFTVFIKHFYFAVFNCIIENNLEIII